MSNETKKYELVKSESIVHNGRTLYRIRALREFTISRGVAIKVGDIGGFVESENNLSQEDICWIFDDAKVYENAKICGDAKICCDAKVFGNAKVWGDAFVLDDAEVWGNAKICDKAEVYDEAEVCGDAYIGGEVQIYGNAKICDKARIFGNAKVHGKSYIFGDAEVCDNAEICGCAKIFGVAKIGGDKIIQEGNYFFKSFTDIEALNEIKTVCYKISFAVRVIELKLPIEQGYIESLISQFAEYNKLADSFCGRTYLSPKEKEILAMLSQCKEDVKILKKKEKK
jgi:carbonic anhydrase/acetyltransferase-like protein (isoleucine patch superfamily)